MTGSRNFASAIKAHPRVSALALLMLGTAILGTSLWRRGAESDVLRADPEAILTDPKLRGVALAGGKPVYENHCASCHGAAGKGDKTLGVPDLTDNDHLYGTGTVSQIEDIARYGIRAGNKRGWNLAVMPAYARMPRRAAGTAMGGIWAATRRSVHPR